jgi:hypothetical protein
MAGLWKHGLPCELLRQRGGLYLLEHDNSSRASSLLSTMVQLRLHSAGNGTGMPAKTGRMEKAEMEGKNSRSFLSRSTR